MKKRNLFLILLVFSILTSCNSITGPEEVESGPLYVSVKVLYRRNTTKIAYPNHKSALVVGYQIYDVNAAKNILEGEWLSPGGYRSGSIVATEVQENFFEAIIEKVYIQGEGSSMFHHVSVSDPKLGDGYSMLNSISEGITITFSSAEVQIVDAQVLDYEFIFKLKEEEKIN